MKSLSLLVALVSATLMLQACGGEVEEMKVIMGRYDQSLTLRIREIKESGVLRVIVRAPNKTGTYETREAVLSKKDSQEIKALLSAAEVCKYSSETDYGNTVPNDGEFAYGVISLADGSRSGEIDLIPMRNSRRSQYLCGPKAKEIASLPLVLIIFGGPI